MANWIEGSLKIRGKCENIERFFDEGLACSSYGKICPFPSMKYYVENKSTPGYMRYTFKNHPKIIGPYKAYLSDQDISYSMHYGKCMTVAVAIKVAWDLTLEEWIEFSNKYDLEVRLFGISNIKCFSKELIIVRGEEPIENIITYKRHEFEWECPFPWLGR